MSDIAIAEMLLNRGANNQPEKQFVPPFAAACEYATAAMVEFLASRGSRGAMSILWTSMVIIHWSWLVSTTLLERKSFPF